MDDKYLFFIEHPIMDPSMRHLIHRAAIHRAFHGEKFEEIIRKEHSHNEKIGFLDSNSSLNEYYNELVEQYSYIIKNDEIIDKFRNFEKTNFFTKIQNKKNIEKKSTSDKKFFINFSDFKILAKISNEMLSYATEKAPLAITPINKASAASEKSIQTGICPVCFLKINIHDFALHIKSHAESGTKIINDLPQISGTSRPDEEYDAISLIELIICAPSSDSKVYNLKNQNFKFLVEKNCNLKENLLEISKETLVPAGRMRLMYESGGFVKMQNSFEDLLEHIVDGVVSCKLFVKNLK